MTETAAFPQEMTRIIGLIKYKNRVVNQKLSYLYAKGKAIDRAQITSFGVPPDESYDPEHLWRDLSV
jgi:hypothetical protein